MGAMEEILALAQVFSTDEEQRRALECEVSFHDFVREFFPIIEPATTFVDNWHIDCICEHLAACSAGEITRIIFNVPPRHMKLAADSTPIYTPTGWTTHGQLRVGEYVFSPSGKAIRIKGVSPKGEANKLVSFSNGEQVKVNGDHLWTVYARNCRKWVTMDTNHLQRLSLFSGGRCTYQLPFVNPLEFSVERSLLLHPYFLGCWLGDGTHTKPVIAHDIDDIEHIEKIAALGYDVTCERPNGGRCMSAEFSRQGITKILRTISVFGDKHIPKEYIKANEEIRLELLAGLIDTDGHVEKETGRVRYCTSSERLRDDVYELCLSLGFRPYISESETPDYGEYKGGKPHWQVGFQPTMYIPTVISRKRIERFAVQRAIGITAIDDCEPEQGNCISVDSDDGLYLIGRTCLPTHNSIIVSVMWNAWEWISNPSLRYLHNSYSEPLSLRDSGKTLSIIQSPKYQRWYGNRFTMAKTLAKSLWTDKAGYRLATSVKGSNTGEGGERLLIDDPHNAKERDSISMVSGVINWYDGVMSSRFNDPKTSVLALIMQRLANNDLTGHLLAKEEFVHVMLPAEFEIGRRCSTRWYTDPRKEEGELLWPERFGPVEVGQLKRDLGTYGAAGQLQQRPSPKGGGMIELDWFNRYLTPPARLRRTTFSVDCANKAKSSSAWNVIEVWGEDMDGIDCLLKVIRFRAEYPELRRNVVSHYLKWSPEAVLIEDKANGIALLQDLANADTRKQIAQQLGIEKVGRIPLIAIEPEGDKIGRMSIESPHIEAGGCALPMFADWLPEFELEITSFPNSEYMDQIDTLSQYLMWKRSQQKRVGVQLARVVGA